MDCESIVKRLACVEAMVTLEPDVDIGKIRSFCVDEPKAIRCEDSDDSCTFFVQQLVCVQIPLRFSATGTAEPAGIVCGPPCPRKEDEDECEKPHRRQRPEREDPPRKDRSEQDEMPRWEQKVREEMTRREWPSCERPTHRDWPEPGDPPKKHDRKEPGRRHERGDRMRCEDDCSLAYYRYPAYYKD